MDIYSPCAYRAGCFLFNAAADGSKFYGGKTMKITLKDGTVKEYSAAMTVADVTKDISMGLYRNACCCKINGEVKDLRTVMDGDCAL